jgi:hypothetical protein
MAKILRAYERNILFGMTHNKILFTVPILTMEGIEYRFNCHVLEIQPTELRYEVLKMPERVERLSINHADRLR